MPTAFTIDADQVKHLEQASREALRRSPEFQRLCALLHEPASQPRLSYATDLHEQKSDET